MQKAYTNIQNILVAMFQRRMILDTHIYSRMVQWETEIAEIEDVFMCLLLTANVSFCLKDLENKCQSLLFGATMLSWINYLTNNFKCGIFSCYMQKEDICKRLALKKKPICRIYETFYLQRFKGGWFWIHIYWRMVQRELGQSWNCRYRRCFYVSFANH